MTSTFALLFSANVGAAYNLTVIGLALVAMKTTFPKGATVSEEMIGLVGAAGLMGSVGGQLLLGWLGDIIGRGRALVLSSVLIIVGALISAAAPHDNVKHQIQIVSIGRLICGLGIGGMYPLSAVLAGSQEMYSPLESREDGAPPATTDVMSSATREKLLVFAGQGWGQMSAPLMFLVLGALQIPQESLWRIALGLGAAPGFLTLILYARKARSATKVEDYIIQQAGDHPDNIERRLQATRLGHASASNAANTNNPLVVKKSLLRTMCDCDNFKKLIGTGGAWLLFDLAFYGNVLFAPLVLKSVFGAKDANKAPQSMAGPTLLTILVGLPGYYVCVVLASRTGLKRLLIGGFLVLIVLYSLLAATHKTLPAPALFALYASTFFVSNAGPNPVTFVLPSQTFPENVKGTFNGLAAAMGKVGAIIGTALFPMVLEKGSISAVLGMAAAASFLGMVLSYFLIESDYSRIRELAADGADGSARFLAEEPRVVVGTGVTARLPANFELSSNLAKRVPSLTNTRTASENDDNPFRPMNSVSLA